MYKFIFSLIFLCRVSFSAIERKTENDQPKHATDIIPGFVIGNFMDDYGIRYHITDSLWLQRPNIKYHIIRWNVKEQYLIARNDDANPGEKGLYSRIDYMQFNNMEPFLWGFCLTVYNAASDSLAEFTAHANRHNPMKGCNGYPFSRMKKIDP